MGVKYYVQLQHGEFLQAMIPKEQFLLGIVMSVNQEINKRRSEGAELTDLGIQDVVPPEEVFMEEYGQELEMVIALLDEINLLERRAKQQVNFQILEALSKLKSRIHEIIEDDRLPFDGPKPIEDPDDIQDSVGENDISGNESGEQVQLDDFFEQWKYNRIIEYKMKLTKYEFLRTRLLRTATEDQEIRMFQRDLKRALLSYSSGHFYLSCLQLQDVLDTYSRDRLLDDILYFRSESSYGCNYLDEALTGYKGLIAEYPESPYSAKALVKIIYIYYIYGQYDKLYDLYQQVLSRKEHLDAESFGTVSYLVAFAQFKAGHYENALNFLGNLEPGMMYFFPSLYLSAACYSNIGKDDLALSIYHRLVEEKDRGRKDPILAQIKNNSLLKLGLMYYELSENERATLYFDRVTEDFQYYDLSVMGKAWSAFKSRRPGVALQNVEWVLENSMISSYVYEARVLAASSKELLGHSEEAIEDLKNVFQTGKQAERIEQQSPNRRILIQKTQDAEAYQQQMQKERDREMLAAIQEIRQLLSNSNSDFKTWESEQTESDYNFTGAMTMLTDKIEVLDRFEEQARDSGNSALLEEIRSLRSDLIDTLDDHRYRASEATQEPEEDPMILRMGMADYYKYIFRSLLMQTLREKEQTRDDIREAEALLREAREQDNFNLGIRMEITKEELHDYFGKLNQHEVWLRENFPQELRVELDQWASFSGYGISNINFSRIKESDRQIAQISQNIDAIDRVFDTKKKDLENRIQGLLSDVAKIEEQMLQEVSIREQKEKDRFFKTEYFNRQRQESVTGKLRENPDLKKKVKK